MRATIFLALISVTYGAQARDWNTLSTPTMDVFHNLRPAFYILRGAAMEIYYSFCG